MPSLDAQRSLADTLLDPAKSDPRLAAGRHTIGPQHPTIRAAFDRTPRSDASSPGSTPRRTPTSAPAFAAVVGALRTRTLGPRAATPRLRAAPAPVPPTLAPPPDARPDEPDSTETTERPYWLLRPEAPPPKSGNRAARRHRPPAPPCARFIASPDRSPRRRACVLHRRRDRHRQGTDRPRRPRPQPAHAPAPTSASTAVP